MNAILALGARAVTMAISLVFGIMTTRMILGEAGVEYYALYSLLVTFPSLLAFTDLGSGAVIVNSVATSDDLRTDLKLRYQLTSVGRILVIFATATMAANTILLVSGGWAAALGDAGELPRAALAAFVCVSVFCLGVPVGIWVRILLGLRKNHFVILLQGLISPLTFAGVWALLSVDEGRQPAFLALASFGASLIVSVLGLSLTARRTSPLISASARMLPRPRRHPGVRVMDVGWPMLAQLVTYPIAVSAQRYVLAHSGTHADVAEYAVAGQVFFAFNGLVIAAGVALWPHYARKRHLGALSRGPFLLSLAFASGIALATAMTALVAPWLFGFITDGALQVAPQTVFWFGAMIMMTAAVYPLGMFIMDKPGIRFQVIPTLCMAATSFTLALVLTPSLGVVGPLIGATVALFACQFVPFIIYIRRHRDRLYGQAPESVTPTEAARDETGIPQSDESDDQATIR